MFTIVVPQFEMHPLVPGFDVPGAPVLPELGVQKRGLVPHWPQTSQHAFNGHGLRSDSGVPWLGFGVLGTCGPHTAFGRDAGMGGSPELRQIC